MKLIKRILSLPLIAISVVCVVSALALVLLPGYGGLTDSAQIELQWLTTPPAMLAMILFALCGVTAVELR